MTSVWYRVRAHLRERASTTVLLVLAVSVPAAVVLASVAGALRARAAVDEFVGHSKLYDVVVFVDPSDETQQVIDTIEALPGWEVRQQVGAAPVSVKRSDGSWVVTVGLAFVDGRPLVDQERPIVVRGTLPDPSRSDQLAVNEDLADALHLEVGDRVPLRTVSPGAMADVSNGQVDVDPNGFSQTMTVTAVVRRPADLRSSLEPAVEGFGTDTWFLTLGPAFVHAAGEQLGNYGFGVVGRADPGQADALVTSLSALGRGDMTVSQVNEAKQVIDSARRGVEFEANALLVFALVVGLTGMALIGQAVSRQVAFDLADDPVLRASGLTRRQRMFVPVIRVAFVAVIGSVLAVAAAVALSPLFPIGVAASAELHPGVELDPRVLGLGAAITLGFVVGWAGLVAFRLTRRGHEEATGHQSALAATVGARAASTGAPVAAVAGIRLALDRGRGRSSVPVLGAVIATTAAVAILAAVVVFTSSLDRLVSTPSLQGAVWDVSAGNLSEAGEARTIARQLRDVPEVADFAGFGSGPFQIDDQPVYGMFLGPTSGSAGPLVIAGRSAQADDEIAMGRDTLQDLGKGLGDSVTVGIDGVATERTFRVVGTVVLPAGGDDQLTLGHGAQVTLGGARTLFPGAEDQVAPQSFFIRFADGVDDDEGRAALEPLFGESVGPIDAPADVDNLERVERLPRLLVVVVGILALGTLTNALVTSVRRRRRDFATFATLGFGRRQLASTVAWQASTFAALAVLVGLPIGVAAGRVVWRLMMDSIGTVVDPSLPVLVLVAVAIVAVAAANLVALVPARSAARTRPAEILRTE